MTLIKTRDPERDRFGLPETPSCGVSLNCPRRFLEAPNPLETLPPGTKGLTIHDIEEADPGMPIAIPFDGELYYAETLGGSHFYNFGNGHSSNSRSSKEINYYESTARIRFSDGNIGSIKKGFNFYRFCADWKNQEVVARTLTQEELEIWQLATSKQ